MATDNLPVGGNTASSDVSPMQILRRILKPVASLRLTVVLFALSIILVVAGTLAQTEKDIWLVIGQYFRCWVAQVEFKVFFPEAFFPNPFAETRPESFAIGTIDRFPFPGGWTIGLLMGLNLFAAHFVRFKAQAKGGRLLAGSCVVMVGMIMTALVIMSGSNKDGFQGDSLITYAQVWKLLLGGIGFAGAACFYASFAGSGQKKLERALFAAIGAALVGLLIWQVSKEDAGRFDDSSMRILWQLLKATFAGIVLYAGCYMVFKKRAGIVVLHGGVGLMMLAELLVGTIAVEQKMTLREGETQAFVYDIRKYELAVVDKSDPKEDDVIAIPQRFFDTTKDSEATSISHVALPFDITIDQFILNSDFRRISPGDKNLADKGSGLQLISTEVKQADGLGSESNFPALYATFTNKESGEKIGTYMLSLLLGDGEVTMGRTSLSETVIVDDESYEVSLRFKREYKPYQITLNDVRKDDYVGTETPRNYSSEIQLVDSSLNVDRKVRIWMNNPLRFAGETFYQSGYNKLPNGQESTTLAVVTNTGWMIPYVSCMIVMVGMLGQFLTTLARFVKRSPAEAAAVAKGFATIGSLSGGITGIAFSLVTLITSRKSSSATDTDVGQKPKYGKFAMVILPAILTVLCIGWVASKARSPKPDANGFDLNAFGELPIAYGGRVKPIDTLARNTLRIISDREQVIEYLKVNGKERGRLPATRWLLDVVTGTDETTAGKHKTFRVDSIDLLTALGLDRRKGFRYSLAEVMADRESLVKHATKAHQAEDAEKFVQISDPGDTEFKEGAIVPRAEFDKANQQAESNAQTPAKGGKPQLTLFDRKVLELERAIGAQRMLQTAFIEPNFSPELPHEELVDIVERMKALAGRKIALVVPTKSEKDSSSWQSLYAEGTRDAIAQFGESKGAKTSSAVGSALVDEFSEASLPGTIVSFLKLLNEEATRRSEPMTKVADEMSLRLTRSPYLQEILKLISAAGDDADAKTVVSSIPGTKLDELKTLRINQSFQDMISGVPANMRPTASSDEETRTFVERMTTAAIDEMYGDEEFNPETNPVVGSWTKIFDAYRADDAETFNKAVAEHQELVAAVAPLGFDAGKVKFESFFNNLAPFYYPLWIYLFAGVLALAAWLGFAAPLNRIAFCLIAATLVIHTFALCSRIYISGRPPVTNLYSSAVFIGWAMVVAGLVFEKIFGRGLGNIVAAVAGSSTLAIAHMLAGDGDTFTVLQAVLDTQFWLATHVVCITLGYAATFLAGLLGLIYVLGGVFTPAVDVPMRKKLSSMIYGTLCFAILLSFFGTVLGGLWADDSWGRFWGWDPKENGALVIVIWNAIVLHARWGGMVRNRGMALLAIAGNIWTACSWFGVNELGVGLHAYGFREGMLKGLGIFIISQLVIMGIGMVPTGLWLSHRKHDNVA